MLSRMDPPVASVMASEIGALGYFFDGKVMDAAGLVSPSALPYLPVPLPLRPGPTAGAIPLGYVLDATPDAVVATSGYVDRTLEPSSAFALAYRLVGRIPLAQPRPSGGVLRIYRRADALD